jgi:intracellular sulfur oxidation DsrE/DsrF family protein
MVILSGIFFSILKGSTKGRIMAEIKQNGSFAVNTMERMIRNAKSVSQDSDASSISIVNQDDGATVFECTGGNIASNGAILLDGNRVKVSNCPNIFTLVEGESGRTPAFVTINFDLEQAVSSGRVEDKSTMNFTSQVVLRNY